MSEILNAIRFWIKASEQDYDSAVLLRRNAKYVHGLFFCHLCLEKLLKALILQNTKQPPLPIHDLVRLAEKSEIPLTVLQQERLAEISAFNISARYDDYKLSFEKKVTPKFAENYFQITQELREWLSKLLLPSM
jgi:HEPN domain-containing protein